MSKTRPRRSAASREIRRLTIMAMALNGATYNEIAEAEGLSRERVRQIVVESLKRSDRDKEDHRRIQAVRLTPALRLALDSIQAGRIEAIDRLLKVLAAQDRYLALTDPKQAREDVRAQLIARLEAFCRDVPDRVNDLVDKSPPSAQSAVSDRGVGP